MVITRPFFVYQPVSFGSTPTAFDVLFSTCLLGFFYFENVSSLLKYTHVIVTKNAALNSYHGYQGNKSRN